jgi:hypothetical protein
MLTADFFPSAALCAQAPLHVASSMNAIAHFNLIVS